MNALSPLFEEEWIRMQANEEEVIKKIPTKSLLLKAGMEVLNLLYPNEDLARTGETEAQASHRLTADSNLEDLVATLDHLFDSER